MVKTTLLIVFMVCTSLYAQDTALLASCCDATTTTEVTDYGRCSGTASCTACKNCSACKHCSKEGGSCGVCTTYEAPKKLKPKAKPKAKAKAKTNKKRRVTPPNANNESSKAEPVPSIYPLKAEKVTAKPKERTKPYKNHEMLEVIAPGTTLRGGEQFTVIEKLEVGQMLTYISTTPDGQWLEVRVDKTGSNGFVFKQFVK